MGQRCGLAGCGGGGRFPSKAALPARPTPARGPACSSWTGGSGRAAARAANEMQRRQPHKRAHGSSSSTGGAQQHGDQSSWRRRRRSGGRVSSPSGGGRACEGTWGRGPGQVYDQAGGGEHPPDWVRLFTSVRGADTADRVAGAVADVSERLELQRTEVRSLVRGSDGLVWADDVHLSVWVPPKSMRPAESGALPPCHLEAVEGARDRRTAKGLQMLRTSPLSSRSGM
ncbi:unnamed protein product [Prorocentrum cordatum]|uniref:Uncharacterized protein n=1 Tax=Prorocentrum cordatum TaxID=2364126 RepID=A0ABN9XTA2_9DINO|nr:unnamed protein product [Polarella glacialis]